MRLGELSVLALYVAQAGALPVLWKLKDPSTSSASLQRRDEPFSAETAPDLPVREPRLLPRRPGPASFPPSSGHRRASSRLRTLANDPLGDTGRSKLQARSEIPAQEKPSDQKSAPNLPPFDLLEGLGKPSFLEPAPAVSSSPATSSPFTIGGPFGSRSADPLLPKSNALDTINPSLELPEKENGLFPSDGLLNLKPPSSRNRPSSNGKTPDLSQLFSLPGLDRVPGSASNPLPKPSPPSRPPLPKAGPVQKASPLPVAGAPPNADLPPPQKRTGNPPETPPLEDDDELEDPDFTDLPPMRGEFTLPPFPNANFERSRDLEDQVTPGQNQPSSAEDPPLREPQSTAQRSEIWKEYDLAMDEYERAMDQYYEKLDRYWATVDKITEKGPTSRAELPPMPQLPKMPPLPELPELNTEYPDPTAPLSPGSPETPVPRINPYAARLPYSTGPDDKDPSATPGTRSSLGTDRYRTRPDEPESAAESQASFIESCYPTGIIGGLRSWDVKDTPDCKTYDFNLYMDKHQRSFKSCSRANICYIKCPVHAWGIQRCTDHCAGHFKCKPIASGISPSRGVL